MRRKLILCLISLTLLTSCTVSNSEPLPIGIWKSDIPDLTIYSNNLNRGPYRGIYVYEGAPYDIAVLLHVAFKSITIYNAYVYDSSTKKSNYSVGGEMLFTGSWKLRRGNLRLKLVRPMKIEGKTIRTIVFRNIEGEVKPEEIFGDIFGGTTNEAQNETPPTNQRQP